MRVIIKYSQYILVLTIYLCYFVPTLYTVYQIIVAQLTCKVGSKQVVVCSSICFIVFMLVWDVKVALHIFVGH